MRPMLTDILRPAPVSSIDGALSLMTSIDGRLPDSDGLKWFNRLYLQVTSSVREAVAGPSFRDARFMSELDVVFANLYFAAIAAGEADVSRAPSAWRPLLRCRTQRGIARLQFALAVAVGSGLWIVLSALENLGLRRQQPRQWHVHKVSS